MRGRSKDKKSEKKPASPGFFSFAYFIALMMTILRLFAIYGASPQPANPQLPDVNQAKKKSSKEKIKSAGKKSKTERAGSLDKVTRTLTTQKEEQAAPPLLKFSILKETENESKPEPAKKSKSQPSVPAAKSASRPSTPPATASVAAVSLMKPAVKKVGWRELKICVSNTRMLISKHAYDQAQLPMLQLINNLAFLYRYLVLNLALRGLMPSGDNNRSAMEDIRVALVHGADFHLFEPELMRETQKAIADLDLQELNSIGSPGMLRTKTKLEGGEISAQMLNIPMYVFMQDIDKKDIANVSQKEIQDWVTKAAIPLINTISVIRGYAKSDDQREACNHALKMMIIMIGEYGPKCGNFDEEGFAVSNTGKFKDFLSDCSQMRNFYAHFCVTESQEKNFEELVVAAKLVNPNYVLKEYDKVNDLLSPRVAKKQMNLDNLDSVWERLKKRA